MKNKPIRIDWEDLEAAFENTNEELVYFLDLVTGRVILEGEGEDSGEEEEFNGRAAVSAAGLIGFVGLIIPHLLRLVLGPDHRLLIPAAALGGAAFLVLCDTAARTLPGGRELPVGAITAMLGGPLFLYLLSRSQNRAPA